MLLHLLERLTYLKQEKKFPEQWHHTFVDNPGPKGGQGGNGKRGGKSGNCGSVAEVKLFLVNTSGQFSLHQITGKGAHPAEHGYGGKGGWERVVLQMRV